MYHRAFSLMLPAAIQIYWNKRKCSREKRLQLLHDWFGKPTWRPMIGLFCNTYVAMMSFENSLLLEILKTQPKKYELQNIFNNIISSNLFCLVFWTRFHLAMHLMYLVGKSSQPLACSFCLSQLSLYHKYIQSRKLTSSIHCKISDIQ